MPSYEEICCDRKKQPLRFYGRRKGRPLSTAMQKRLDEMLPKLAVPAGFHTMTSLAACFAATPVTTISLEIGFGGGEHLAALAKASPDSAFIGAEPFVNGIASLLRHIEEQNLQNIRIWPDDVRLILSELPEASLSSVYIMFPDPWPKTRHASRRIFNSTTLDKLAFCVKLGGSLRFASDHPVAKSWLLAGALHHPAFSWTVHSARDWRERPADWPQTRYMAKSVREGRAPSWFDFKRI